MKKTYATIREKAMKNMREAEQLKYNFAVVDANDFNTVIGFTTDLRDAKEMANRHTKNDISNGKIIKLKKPMSQKKGDMMINRPMSEGMVKVTNIKWDSDDDVSDLSTTMMVPVPNGMDQEEAEEFIADYITDKTGVTHDGFRMELSEGPFTGVGKMMMKRKLNKQYKKSDLANFDDLGIDTSGKTTDEINQMKSDYYHDHMDKADRAKNASNRLSKNVKYGIIRYPDTAISYIKNDGSGWTHIYDRSYGFEGPVDKADMKYASSIKPSKVPSRMMDEGYYKMPDIDRERYTEMPGLEGPFQTKSGKVVYYDPKEGAYYDRDTDMYMTYDEFKALDEGHSPHKKGTKKYKAHMAAMHANSVDLNSMRDALNLKEGNDSDVVAGYVRTMLNEKHDTWNKVTNEIDFVLGLLKENNADRQTVFNKLYSMNYKDNLDNNIVLKENIDTLRDIVNNKSVMTVKFQDGTMKVDMTTANIFLQAYDKMKESNQEKISEMMKTKKGFLRVLDFIYGAMK